jgi:RNA polymerase sigma-70 factor (ECF subfamily)
MQQRDTHRKTPMRNTSAANRDLDTQSPEDCRDASRNSLLTAWFETWRASMCRWATSRASIQATDIDTLAQEVFLRLQRDGSDAAIEDPQSYLFRTATNVVDEWREHPVSSPPHDGPWLEARQADDPDNPESAATLVSEQVRSAVMRLPPRQREVLLLHIKDNLTYKQIAIKFKLSPRDVRRDIARVYAEVRGELRTVDLDASLYVGEKIHRTRTIGRR